jgi:hypothetical protein
MKILFTGMGSSHCKKTDNASFFSSLADGYSELAEVVWSAPKITWSRADLESFDLVFLGFMPITSKSANHLYGALHVLNLLYESPKLRLVVDNPQIWQYKNSISSFRRAPEQIFTDFYRIDPTYLGLTIAQYICILLFITFGTFITINWKKAKLWK